MWGVSGKCITAKVAEKIRKDRKEILCLFCFAAFADFLGVLCG